MIMVLGLIVGPYVFGANTMYLILGGYGVFLVGITLFGLYAAGDSANSGQCCALSGFFSIFPAFFILMVAPYPLGIDHNIHSPTFMEWGPYGIAIVAFAVTYLFLGIIISIIRVTKSTDNTITTPNTLTKPKTSYEYHPDERDSSHEMVIEREKLLVRRIPPQCFKCGADINPEEVDWIGPDTVRCIHCGASLVVEFERV